MPSVAEDRPSAPTPTNPWSARNACPGPSGAVPVNSVPRGITSSRQPRSSANSIVRPIDDIAGRGPDTKRRAHGNRFLFSVVTALEGGLLPLYDDRSLRRAPSAGGRDSRQPADERSGRGRRGSPPRPGGRRRSRVTPAGESVRAGTILRLPGVWIGPLVITAVLTALIALIYIGSVINPTGAPPRPTGDGRQPATPARPSHGRRVDLGEQIVDALQHASPVTSRLALTSDAASARRRRRWTRRRRTERW